MVTANTKMLALLIPVIVFFIASVMFPSLTTFAVFSLAAAAFLIVDKFGKAKILPSGMTTIIAVGAVAGMLFFSGALSIISPSLTSANLMATFGIPSAAFDTTISDEQQQVVSTECKESVSEEIKGLAAQISVAALDQASNAPRTTKVPASVNYYKNGDLKDTIALQTTLASITDVAVGDVITFYDDGTNSTSYVSTKTVCVDSQRPTVLLDGWRAVTDSKASASDLQISGYDKTGSVALSGGTNTTEEDYDITLGANQEEAFYLEIKVNAQNDAFRLGGLATITLNDAKDCKPAPGQGFTSIALPNFLDTTVYLANTSFNGISTTNETTNGWEKVYKLDTPVMLTEWQFKKYQFIAESSTTTDPTTTVDADGSDICAIVFLDSAVSIGGDATPTDGLFQDDVTQANVGVSENVSHPVGLDASVVIEYI